MAWIEVHQALPTHRKTLAAADALGIEPVHVVGHLVALWLWALDNAPDGAVAASAHTLARVAYWRGKPAAFAEALETAGFIKIDVQGMIIIHDWEDYAGRLVERRRADTLRKRAQRAHVPERASVGHPQEDRRTSAGNPLAPYPTVPHRTVPVSSSVSESIKTKRGRGTSVAPAEKKDEVSAGASPKTRRPDLIWDALAEIYGEIQTPNERGARNAAVKQFREGARANGKTEEEIAQLIAVAHDHWANVMGDATETPLALAKHFGLLLAGPQVEGRDAGRSTERGQLRGIDAYIDIVEREREQKQEAAHAIHRSERGSIIRPEHGPSHGQLPAP